MKRFGKMKFGRNIFFEIFLVYLLFIKYRREMCIYECLGKIIRKRIFYVCSIRDIMLKIFIG